MTTGAFDAIAQEPAASLASEQRLFGNVCRLVPSSGLQFVDAGIDAGGLPMLRAWFTEDEIDGPAGPRRVLLPLSSDAGADGTIWHPVTFRPLGPADTLSFTGLEALEPFLDTWTPVPFLRYLGRADDGALRFDHGPANWARIYIAKPAEGLRGADRLKAVFAFDTRLDARSRADQTPYLAPNADDALFASTFMLADDPQELAGFLSQTWVDAWVRESCRSWTVSNGLGDLEEAGFRTTVEPDSRFSLAHTARYLAFLKILSRAANPPQIRFVDSISRTLPVATTAVDLVIDFGAAETTALLIERDRPIPADIAQAAANAIPLRLRNLNCPVNVHTGAIATAVEFDHLTFGNAALSRRSGRADAFQWTSLVRIGTEAKRLALRTNATDGITGHSDIAGHLDKTEASDTVWRFSTLDQYATKTGPMVTGDALRHLSETGDMMTRGEVLQLRGNTEPAQVPAVRPRFSQSSLAGFFVVEVLLHAIGEINAAAGSPFAKSSSERNDVRHIERVIITSPLAMPANERQLLIERVHSAIDLLWRTQQWDQPGQFAQPAKPQLSLGIGPDVGLQLVYLFNEVKSKFGGAFSDLVDCVRRRTGEPDARDNLRISSIELGRCAAGLTIIDYEVAHDGTVQAALVLSDRTPVGGERVVDAILEKHILVAIERSLAASGLTGARGFLLGLLAGGDDPDAANPLGKRLFTKVLKPAAIGVFETYADMPRRGAEGLRRFRIDGLVAAGGGRLDPIATQFDAAAHAAGASSFRLGAVSFDIGRRQVQRIVATELWPTVNAMAGAIHDTECDILLMAGDLADLPDLLDHVLSLAPVPAGRIVVLGNAGASRQTGSEARSETQDRAVLGAYMASRNLLEAAGFSLVTRDLAQTLTGGGRQHASLSLMPGSGRPSSPSAEAHPERSFTVLAGGGIRANRDSATTILVDDGSGSVAHVRKPPIERAR